jgi:RNA polymerase sigma factor (sigma-70 family)
MGNKRHKLDYRILDLNNIISLKSIDKGDENLLRYFYDMQNYKQLTQDEEQNMIKLIKGGAVNSEALKTKLICSHQPFVVTFAKRHCPNGSEQMLDLIQEGNYGMLVALENFRLDANVKFMTYANSWIVKYMYKFLENNELIQHNNRSKTFGAEIKIREKFVKDHGYEPTSKELFDAFNEVGISLKHEDDVDKITIIPLSTVPSVKPGSVDDDDDTVFEFGKENSIIDDIDKSLNCEKIHFVMKCLTDEESDTIKKAFGFYGVKEDISTIAYELGISDYKVKQTIKGALRKMKRYKKLFDI